MQDELSGAVQNMNSNQRINNLFNPHSVKVKSHVGFINLLLKFLQWNDTIHILKNQVFSVRNLCCQIVIRPQVLLTFWITKSYAGYIGDNRCKINCFQNSYVTCNFLRYIQHYSSESIPSKYVWFFIWMRWKAICTLWTSLKPPLPSRWRRRYLSDNIGLSLNLE